MGFTPDCKYPVVYGEKGMARFKVTSTNNIDEDTYSYDYIENELYAYRLLTV